MVITTLNTQNPFADYGSIVYGNRFIGRKKEIQAIHNRVLGDAFGNIAIIGLPRIGKTSLVWNSLMSLKDDFSKKNHYIFYINIGTISDSKDFFKALIQSIAYELEDVRIEGAIINKINYLITKLKEYEKDRFEFNNQVQIIFKFIKRMGFRITYILDEFDNAEKVFSIADFQLLRELASKPETQICLVTVSRKSLQEIEPESGGISDFHGIFKDLWLGVFNQTDIEEYWQNVSKLGIEVSPDYRQEVNCIVGSHPNLLNNFNYYVFNKLNAKSESSADNIFQNTESDLRLSMLSSFDLILNLLRRSNLYTKAMQLVLGPVYDVNTIDEQKLIKYQFLKEVDSEFKNNILSGGFGLKTHSGNAYICFSEYFTQYWKLKMYETDFWGLWKDTEIAIRDLIKGYLAEKFDTAWEEKYLLQYPSENRKSAINKLETERDKYQNNFGSLASSHIVDYTYPKDMYDLFIANDWTWFSKIFSNNDKRFWTKVFIELAFLRNPVAHNNSQFVPIDRINEAKSYCDLILEKISAWKQGR